MTDITIFHNPACGTSRNTEQLLDLMQQHPILMERPIVQTALGTKVCRRSQEVLELLPVPRIAPFAKEDGALIQDPGHRRAAA